MGWQYFPVKDGDDIQNYNLLVELWKAVRDRNWVMCNWYFPPPNKVWDDGNIATLTNTQMTISPVNEGWLYTTSGGTVAPRWVDFIDPDFDDYFMLPRNYRVILGARNWDKPWQIVSARIGNNDDHTLYFSSSLNLSQAEIAEIMAEGHYAIIGDEQALWWSDRMPPLPNPPHYLESSATVTPESGAYRFSDSSPFVHLDHYKGKLVAFQCHGRTRYGTIVEANDHDMLVTASDVPDSGSSYAVLVVTSPPDFYFFNAKPNYPFRDYSGVYNTYWSRATGPGGDGLGGAKVPAPTIDVLGPDPDNPDDCIAVTKPCFDLDFRTDFDDPCNPADEFAAPDFWHTLRSIQQWVEGNCGVFVLPINYDDLKAINWITIASLFCYLQINNGTSSITSWDSMTGNLHTSFPTTPEVRTIYWEEQDANGVTVTAGTLRSAGGDLIIGSDSTNKRVGDSIIYSYGYPRQYPREFLTMFDRHYFDGDQAPDADNPGNWTVRSKSTTYAVTDENWLPGDYDPSTYSISGTIGQTIESDKTFVSGDYARYRADNYCDPTTQIRADGGTDPIDGLFQDHGRFVGRTWAEGHLFDLPVSGFVADAGPNWLRDANKSWLPYGRWNGFQGTATGGSSGSIQCSTVFGPDPDYTGGGSPPNILLDGRWDSSTGRWAGFIVTVTSGPCAGMKAPITSYNQTNYEIFFSIPGFNWQYTDGGGTHNVTFSIEEPAHILNRWEGRTVTIWAADETLKGTATIQYSDGDTLWFTGNPSFQILQGDSYKINDPDPGTVWKWDGSKWVVPPEAAEKKGDTNIALYQKKLEPTRVRAYGRWCKGDDVTTELLNSIYKTINALRWTKAGYSWTANGQNNQKFTAPNFDDGYDPNDHTSAENLTYFEGLWEADSESVDGPPGMAGSVGQDVNEGPNPGHLLYDFSARYAYGKIDKCNFLACAVDWYSWSEFLDSDSSIVTFSSINDYATAHNTLPDGSFAIPPGHISSTGDVGNWDESFEVDYYQLASEGAEEGDDSLNYVYSDGEATGTDVLTYGGWTYKYHHLFDDNGQKVAFRKWKKWTTTGPDNATEVTTSDKLGSISMPNIESSAADDDNPDYWRGFIVTNQEAILRWDVAGGIVRVN